MPIFLIESATPEGRDVTYLDAAPASGWTQDRDAATRFATLDEAQAVDDDWTAYFAQHGIDRLCNIIAEPDDGSLTRFARFDLDEGDA